MGVRSAFIGLACGLCVALACQTPDQYLDERETLAVARAEQLGRSALGCPRVQGVVLSRRLWQPALVNPGSGGAPEADYEVRVRGCGSEIGYRLRCTGKNCQPIPEAPEG